MDYELAKELKEAGFPEGEDGGIICECDSLKTNLTVSEILGHDHVFAYIPTLEELINACGDSIQTLYKGTQGWWIASNDSAAKTDWENFAGLHCDGPTPLVATARLYLALHKK